jgi:hypothetical protein
MTKVQKTPTQPTAQRLSPEETVLMRHKIAKQVNKASHHITITNGTPSHISKNGEWLLPWDCLPTSGPTPKEEIWWPEQKKQAAPAPEPEPLPAITKRPYNHKKQAPAPEPLPKPTADELAELDSMTGELAAAELTGEAYEANTATIEAAPTEEQGEAAEPEQGSSQPFPLEQLPPKIASHIKLCDTLHISHTAYLAVGYLATLSTFAGALYELESGITKHIGNGETGGTLYFAVVGKSSDGKSLGIKEFMRPAEALDLELTHKYQTEAAEYKKQRRAWAAEVKKDTSKEEPTPPAQAMYYIKDATQAATIEQLKANAAAGIGTCMFVPELTELTGAANRSSGHDANYPQFLINTYDRAPLKISRKGNFSDGEFSGTLTFIPKPALTLVGGIQRTALHSLINPKYIGIGFAPRFLFVAPVAPARPYKPANEDQAAELNDYQTAWAQQIAELHRIATANPERKALRIKLTSAAEAVHQQFEVEITNELNELDRQKDHTAFAMLAKHREIFLRLALLIHIGEHLAEHGTDSGFFQVPTTLTAETLQRAINLQKYFKNQLNHLLDREIEALPIEKVKANVRQYFEVLPSSFKRKDLLTESGKAAAAKCGANANRTIDKYLKILVGAGALKTNNNGEYHKA